MAFLKKALKWMSPGVEPSEDKKAQGFQNGEFPSAGHFDFMFKSTADAIEELQAKAGEVKTVNGQSPNANGNIDVSIDTNLLATKEELTTHKLDYVSHPGTGTTTNSGNAYAVTLNPAPTAYVDKMGLVLAINADSTGASTINVNGLGAKAIKKANGNDITNLKNGGIYSLRYNASTGNFILQGEGGEYGTATASDVLSGKTFGTENGLVNGILTLASLGGKKWASGTLTTDSTGKFTISGLAFKPKIFVAKIPNGIYTGTDFILYVDVSVLNSTIPINVAYKSGQASSSSSIITVTDSTIAIVSSQVYVPQNTTYNWIAIE